MLVNETKNRTCAAASQPSDQQTTHSDEIAISVKNLSKKYRIFGHPGDRIKQALTFGRVRFYREFTALQDVSFDIKKGETVGIIGRNGSGKSTLLPLRSKQATFTFAPSPVCGGGLGGSGRAWQSWRP